VADAPDGLEQLRARGVGLELLAQAPDVDRDGSGVERRGVAPHAVHQLVAREDAVRVRRQEPEQVEFLRRQVDALAVPACLVPRGVDDQRSDGDPLARRRGRTRASQNRFDAGRQVSWGERLRDVVVGAQLQADNPVGLVDAGCQKDHRQVRTRSELIRRVCSTFETLKTGSPPRCARREFRKS
jgi:hypothetical protein